LLFLTAANPHPPPWPADSKGFESSLMKIGIYLGAVRAVEGDHAIDLLEGQQRE
jgi:hypothetical protein